ncbi:hypothetical protein K438DRAFT_1860088, partial [Mycena galopus ATCC 62051]
MGYSDSIATAERSNSETWALEFGAAERGTVFLCSALPRRRYNLDASKFSMNRTWYIRNQSFSAGMTRLKRSDIKRVFRGHGCDCCWFSMPDRVV